MLLIKFADTNSVHVSVQMALYEAFYGRRCKSLIGRFEVSETRLIEPDLVHHAMEKMKVIQERLQLVERHQKSYIDITRKKT